MTSPHSNYHHKATQVGNQELTGISYLESGVVHTCCIFVKQTELLPSGE
jgi:hypothetical protein